MQPLIRRTITLTITENWTITWQDGRETVWQTTREAALPNAIETRASETRVSEVSAEVANTTLPLASAEDEEKIVLDPDAANLTAQEE